MILAPIVVREAIGLKAQNSADYIQLYSGNKDTLAESLEHVQHVSAELLAAITPSDWQPFSRAARVGGPHLVPFWAEFFSLARLPHYLP